MAWPSRIYAATKVSGVYYTDNFVGPDTQPTWTAVNTGLAATDCREFFLDPFHQAERQYVMLEASRSLYRREDGGAWSVIFDYDTAHTVLGSTPLYGETLYGFCVDPQTDGRLWVSYKYVYDPVGTYDYVFTSDDYGDSWSAILFYTGNSYDIQSPRCNGDSIFVPHVSGAGGAYHIQYTANAGANWSISTQAAFGWKTSIAVNPLTGIAYIEQDVLATHDLAYLEDDGTTGTLQADITLSRNDAMWFDPTDADHQRLVHNSRLYVTTDSWANRNAPSAISYGVISIAPWAGNDTDQMLVGLTINHGVGQDHAVAALYGESDTSAVGIAGSSPDSPPYTDSIPYGCGGVCSMGVQAVEGTGVVHTYSVAMPGYTGTERGEPVPGDRASWETGAMHADDIQDASFQYHNNPADPPMLVSDYDSDDDGIVDAAETAPWAGITDKPTEFTPEDHDHSGDAGDGGTFDAANLTSGASTDGQVLTSDGAGGAAWEDPAGGASAFTDLTDTPADYTDDGGKYVRVNSGETALEFVDLPETAYAETIGDGIDDTFDIVHNLDSTDVIVQVWDLDATPVTLFEPDSIHVIDADTVRVVFASAPDTDQMRVVVVIGGGESSGDSTYTAAYASRPAASNAGDLFMPSDGFVIERDTGAAWAPWGPLFPMTPPVDGDFAWVNQGGASVDAAYGGIYLLDPAAANNHARLRVKAAPATPYTITAWLRPHIHAVDFNFCGLAWRNSSDGKLSAFQYGHNTNIVLEVAKWSDENTVNSSYTSVAIQSKDTIALRIADDGTNRICSWSMDGQHWHVVHTVGRTDYLTPDQVGFFANSVNATWPAGVTLLSWKEG